MWVLSGIDFLCVYSDLNFIISVYDLFCEIMINMETENVLDDGLNNSQVGHCGPRSVDE